MNTHSASCAPPHPVPLPRRGRGHRNGSLSLGEGEGRGEGAHVFTHNPRWEGECLSVNSIGSGAGGINSQAAGRKPPSSTNGEHATRGSPDPGARPPAGGWTRARAVAYPATGA